MKRSKIINAENNSQQANERGGMGNDAAKNSRDAREERNEVRLTLRDWQQIFADSPLLILTGLFIFSILMEVFFSWPMYLDLMSQMTGSASPTLSLLCAIFIVLFGAYASHLIAKAISPAIFTYSVYNDREYKNNEIPRAAAEEKARIQAKREFINGICLSIFLLILVAGISWQRVWLMGSITGTDYSITHKILPVICVGVEIISGIFINYLLRRMYFIIRQRNLHKRFIIEKALCAKHTAMAYAFYNHAVKNNEDIIYSREIRDTIYRYEFRSLDHEDYVDEIPPIKTLKILVCEDSKPKAGIHLAGTLSNGEYCNSIYTNENGEGILSWDCDAKEVLVVYTDQKIHKGPFRENSSIRLDINFPKKLDSSA